MSAKQSAYKAKEEEREAKEKEQEELEKKEEEERKIKEQEEFEKWKDMFSVDEEGAEGGDKANEYQDLLGLFIEYMKVSSHSPFRSPFSFSSFSLLSSCIATHSNSHFFSRHTK